MSYYPTYDFSNGSRCYETLLDRKPLYNSTYSSDSYGSSSSYDRYNSSYISDLLSPRSGSYDYKTPRGGSGYSSVRKKYYDQDDGSKYNSVSLHDLGSYSSPSSDYSSWKSTRFGSIGSAPAYNKFGRELSNYERWKIAQGSPVEDSYGSGSTSNGYSTSTVEDRPIRTSYSSYASTDSSDGDVPRRRRFSKTNNFKDREFSVIPTSNSSFLDDDVAPPLITGSRFSGKSVPPQSRRGESVQPSYLPPISDKPKYGTRSVNSFPADVRSKLIGYDVRDVRGDGGCYYRCLSVYFTGAEDSYNKYRKEVMGFIKDNLENYNSMIKSEIGYASINDYFSRKTRSDRQEFAETTEIIATSCLYNINVHVLALVPGSRRSWEWLHFDPSIGSGKPSHASRDIYLYNQGSVHFMLCTPK